MNIHDIFPLGELRLRYPRLLTVEQYGKSDVLRVAELAPKVMNGLCLHAWHRMLKDNEFEHLDPALMEVYIDGPLYQLVAILDALANPIFYDFSYIACRNDEGILVGQLIVADVCPNNLHIADVYFQNPESPLHDSRLNSDGTGYNGFGLLGKVLDNAECFARENRNDIVALVAASDSRVLLFERYGYRLSDDKNGKYAREMFKRISNLTNA